MGEIFGQLRHIIIIALRQRVHYRVVARQYGIITVPLIGHQVQLVQDLGIFEYFILVLAFAYAPDVMDTTVKQLLTKAEALETAAYLPVLLYNAHIIAFLCQYDTAQQSAEPRS